jgi:hypothetical protein
MTDSRADSYVSRFGYQSWELDALDPSALGRIVREAVYAHRDPDLWEEAVAKQDSMKGELEEMAMSYRDSTEKDDGA